MRPRSCVPTVSACAKRSKSHRNAIKHSPESKPVYVAVRRRGGTTRITVLDSGIGIPESDRAQIFSRFLRAATLGAWALLVRASGYISSSD
jgi:light-regulated signal transduction histidine kinase (bacteriophytochrome)